MGAFGFHLKAKLAVLKFYELDKLSQAKLKTLKLASFTIYSKTNRVRLLLELCIKLSVLVFPSNLAMCMHFYHTPSPFLVKSLRLGIPSEHCLRKFCLSRKGIISSFWIAFPQIFFVGYLS